MELKRDLHIIPVSNGNLVYSPLRRGLFWASNDASHIIYDFLEGDEKILEQVDEPAVRHLRQLSKIEVVPPTKDMLNMGNSLVVIPSQACNLACSYCFASKAHAKDIIDKSILVNAYDYILKSEGVEKCFSFIGGGEPMLTWDIIKWSFEYISSHNNKNDKILYNITTNASILNEEILSSLREHNVHLNISFDVLKEVQDVQRPFHNNARSSFDAIHNNLLLLDKSKISYSIRSTITARNVALMLDMVQFVVDNYQNVKSLHFEPVTDNNQEGFEYYHAYVHYFFQARKIAKSNGIDLYNSMTRSVFNIKDRFCNGEFCVTPSGDIVACHRVSSPRDEDFELFSYGKVTVDGVYIAQEKYQEFISIANTKRMDCERCFAYWHCAGICPMERMTLSERQLILKCEFIREIIKRTLLEYLRK